VNTVRTIAALAASLATAAVPAVAAPPAVHNVVLVHGGFVDGSGWQGVYNILKKDGYNVVIVQNPTTSLADDVKSTHNALATVDGPAILVGHSYGGIVISESGNDPKVKALVYITAFAADAGESVGSILSQPQAGETPPPILPPANGFLLLDKGKFPAAFAGDLKPLEAEFMADSQVPWGMNTPGDKVTNPAWRSHPSYYLVSTDDHMIPPRVQRMMATRAKATVVESPGSHAVYVSHPKAVADLIERAAREVSAPTK
jgi:pimeloyl-ACP methyl ester carboxylesterase